MKKFTSALLCLALTGCAYKTPVSAYLPPAAMAAPSGASGMTEGSAEFLQSMHEPSLWELSQKDNKAEVYRFFVLRPDYHPFTFRLVMQSGRTYGRIGWGLDGKPKGTQDFSVTLGQKDVIRGFASEVDKADFWNLTSSKCPDETSHWMLEGVKAGKYHVVDRCVQDDTDPIGKLGILAYKLSGLKVTN